MSILQRLTGCLALALLGTAVPATPAGPPASGTNIHWAFQPVRAAAPPTVRNAAWVSTPVDRFILSRLEAAGLEPSPSATAEQLIRRLALGLTGLPPAPEEIQAFVSDRSTGRVERLIDRLLASPHYGERWARHWLDLARYAESDGFEHDAVRPHAWRYRDYVVQAFNDDKPYDRFLREQLAGDELWPDDPAALIATGFNLLGPDMVDSADQTQRRLNTLNDMTDSAASVFFGLTFGCARCHDHKFEPLSQHDYFSMQAFFAPAVFRREQPVPTAATRAAHDGALAEYNARTKTQRRQIEDIEQPARQKLFDEKLSKLSEDVQIAHRTPRERRTMEQEGTVQETASQVKVTDADLTRALSNEDKARRTALEAELKKVPKPAALPLAMVLQNTSGPAPVTHVLARGDYNNPREVVQPGFPAVLPAVHPAGTADASARHRARLAGWMAAADHPLTARVMVNRIWQHHFGRGLVRTPGDFGTRGTPPTHPELLDWLAAEFVQSGWSVKRMHRLLLLSAAYQQSSTPGDAALARDPDNRLFSRQNRVRLEGEVIRDSLLAISGRLNPEPGGPPVSPPIPADLARTARNWTASTDPRAHDRRSLYIFARRNLRFPFLEVFDAPDSNLSCPERGRSTTAPQSLTLLNSAEVMAASRATAARVQREAASTDSRINQAFRLILGRAPTPKELSMAREFLESCKTLQASASSEASATAPPGTAAGSDPAWRELCRSLFNLNGFVYVE